ncbi:metal-dependent hydrolase family protein [Phocicoccus pinnipedialis]|uniref:Imidazolonepropionase n=1 Tax=Phocicoccus pinnipedialis TaxID=110845 RepID=A0A6V7REC0_9BACL|nr:amidohydrolase family protein [Jeotgalicoccus pinnipedialis]MBP1939248.1 imidazolonepropionase-like amidohydrolase [Jeotgalicoccus pinnipedialis]CAD2076148.1 Imidazolonepropionase [Jeotgalicoccus pinnipedialis]
MSKLLVKNISLINGSGDPLKENTSILIEDGVYTAINPKNISDTADVIDGEGKYLLPGMIDTHVHLATEFQPLAEKIATPFSYNFFHSIEFAKRTIDAGVTTVRDAYGADLGFKKAIEDGLIDGPRMQISVSALSITGGHGDSMNYSGIEVPFIKPHPGLPSNIADGVEEVRKKTREILRAGADVIKVMATGGVSTPTDHPRFTQYSLEELKVIVEEAEFRNGVKVMAHAQGAEGIKQCLDAGIHSIEHGIYLTDEIIEQMKEQGTYLVPTLLAPLSVIEFAEELGVSAVGLKKSKEVLQDHIDSFKKAYKAGVKIAMGTDAGVFKHGTNLRELELMVQHGMTPMDAIVASTKVAAECMQLDNVGQIKEGYLADFILVDKNPLEDIAILKDIDNILVVAKEGKILKDIR